MQPSSPSTKELRGLVLKLAWIWKFLLISFKQKFGLIGWNEHFLCLLIEKVFFTVFCKMKMILTPPKAISLSLFCYLESVFLPKRDQCFKHEITTDTNFGANWVIMGSANLHSLNCVILKLTLWHYFANIFFHSTVKIKLGTKRMCKIPLPNSGNLKTRKLIFYSIATGVATFYSSLLQGESKVLNHWLQI